MSRKPSDKPWLHAKSGYWCATANGKREYLDKDYKLAFRKLRASRAWQNREEAGDRIWLEASLYCPKLLAITTSLEHNDLASHKLMPDLMPYSLAS